MENDGGLKDEGGATDPVSGNDVPIGSTKEEVRDDIPAQLSEGEFVFPADVVRFIGLNRLMEMRQEAKQGLKKMEAMGQMGNADEATVPDDLPFDETDIIAEDDDGNAVEMQQGGLTPSSTYNQYMGGAGIKQAVYVNPETGDEILVYIVSGTPVPAIPPGYVPKGTKTPDAIKESKITNSIQPVVEEDPDAGNKYTVHQGKMVRIGGDITITDADDWANLQGESIFDRAVDQSKAPAGWNTQNQREYNTLKAEGYNVKAMWNGSDWDVYSPDLDGSAYGTPGRRGLQSKYPDQIKAMFKGVTSGALNPFANVKEKGKPFTDMTSGIHQSYIDGVKAAGEKKKVTVTTAAGKGPGTTKPRPRTETELKNLGINKTKSVASANQTKTQTSTSDDDDKFREQRRAQAKADKQAEKFKEEAKEKFKDKEFNVKRDERTF
tara:strand:- start:2864 stop:4171 length:1308 start_codon:yes stop_codon:yes gene_type:complete